MTNGNRNSALILLTALVFVLSQPRLALATWSITAVDPQTKQVGIAGASCTDFVYGIAGVAPGKGVIVAQAMSNMKAKSLGEKMLLEGASPQEVLAAITDPVFDPDFSKQQYGIVALGFEDQSVSYTGAETPGFKGDLRDFGVSVQGNILTDAKVVSNALAAFQKAAKNKKMSLADRLMAALEAGTEGGGGDRRCGEQRARSAFIVVESPTATVDGKTPPYLLIKVTGQEAGEANPLELLRKKYDEWRMKATNKSSAPSSKQLSAEIDEYMNAAVKAEHFSGSILVAKDGQPIISQGYGMANFEVDVPNTPNTIFRIASLSKAFTAAMIMQLQEKGKLNVNDGICQYLENCPQTWQPITIKHLLTHTSGIVNYTNFPGYEKTAGQFATNEEIVRRFRDKPLEFIPGEQYKYSNSGYHLLGIIIEKASGQSYAGYLQENILAPLGMRNTGIDINNSPYAVEAKKV